MTTTQPRPAVTAQDLGYDVRPLGGLIGAEILGVDLSRPLDATAVAAIRATLLEYKVIFFRDQDITQAQHIAFGRYFGDVTPAHPTLPAAFDDFPEILLLDNQRYAPMGAATVESRWHTDVTFVPNPPMGSILRGMVVPPYGGDTQFTNLAVAYDRLSEPIKQMLDGLHAVHHNTLPISRGEMSSELRRRKAEAVVATGAEVVASANTGCTMQIAAGLRELGSPMHVLHPVEILDLAYAAEPPEAAPAAPGQLPHVPSA